jgi:hypothetical protein
MPIIPALGKQRQEDDEIKANLGNQLSFSLGCVKIHYLKHNKMLITT